jgi:hypothetical protein
MSSRAAGRSSAEYARPAELLFRNLFSSAWAPNSSDTIIIRSR